MNAQAEEKRRAANQEALRRMAAVQPFLVDVQPAGKAIRDLGEWDFLHAGPPLDGWHEACGALRGAVAGTLIRSGVARSMGEAEAAARDSVRLRPAHDVNALGTYAGVITRNTPVLVVEDRASGCRAYAALNEGRGKALRYGSCDADTLARLAWLEEDFADILRSAIRLSGGIDLFAILEQALHMGDDGHSRQKAASALFANMISPFIVAAGHPATDAGRALRFLAANDIFFLPLTMAAARAVTLSAAEIPGGSVVTCIAFNGVRCGIRVNGLGQQWFTVQVPVAEGAYFAGFSSSDAGPVIGDSEIAETIGLGAFAMAGAPALARYVGGTVEEGMRLTLDMYRVTVGEHPRFKMPALSYRGTPFGIDVAKVVDLRSAPVFNTGIAHRTAGIGQIGAGFGRVPLACFEQALDALGEADAWMAWRGA